MIRTWMVVRCERCGHQWDEDDPDSEVCACIDTYGSRQVRVISNGATNAAASPLSVEDTGD